MYWVYLLWVLLLFYYFVFWWWLFYMSVSFMIIRKKSFMKQQLCIDRMTDLIYVIIWLTNQTNRWTHTDITSSQLRALRLGVASPSKHPLINQTFYNVNGYVLGSYNEIISVKNTRLKRSNILSFKKHFNNNYISLLECIIKLNQINSVVSYVSLLQNDHVHWKRMSLHF